VVATPPHPHVGRAPVTTTGRRRPTRREEARQLGLRLLTFSGGVRFAHDAGAGPRFELVTFTSIPRKPIHHSPSPFASIQPNGPA